MITAKKLTQANKRSLINTLEKAMSKLVDAGFKVNGVAGQSLQSSQRSLRDAIDRIESI